MSCDLGEQARFYSRKILGLGILRQVGVDVQRDDLADFNLSSLVMPRTQLR